MATRVFLVFIPLLVACQLKTVQGSVLECQTTGKFPHPEDCGKYVVCLQDGPVGQFTAKEGYCFGFPYSPTERRCVSHDQQPDCFTKGLRNSLSVPHLNFLCNNGRTQGCFHCKLPYFCINNSAYVSQCDEYEACSEHVFGSPLCLPYSYNTDVCFCNKTGLMPDYYNDTYYMFCIANANQSHVTSYIYACPEGKTFSSTSNNCEESKPPVTPETPSCDGSTATRVNPNDCSYFYTCLPDNTVRTSSCGVDKYFFEKNGTCVPKCSVITHSNDEYLCQTEGKVWTTENCTRYHLCLKEGEKPHATKKCPTGYFNSLDKACSTQTPPPECIVFDYSKCPGHDKLNC
ncbi:uncharacterized protein [Cherax quadricarinatus]|nr:uncharacterized protein LOC128686080 [Cherax quadricarinatus]